MTDELKKAEMAAHAYDGLGACMSGVDRPQAGRSAGRSPPMTQLNAKALEAAYAAYEATGISYDAMGITAAIRAYLASQEAAAPSEEPVAIAGNVELLQHQLDTFGPSPDGAVERDLAYAKELRASPAVAPAMTPLGREFEEAWDRNAEALYESEPAVAPVAVSVKELIWTEGAKPDYAGNRFWRAPNTFDRGYRIYFEDGRYVFRDRGSDHDTLELAKAAAQSDFNARILSSIIPATKGGEVDDYCDVLDSCLETFWCLTKEGSDDRLLADGAFDAVKRIRALSAQDTDGVAKP